MALDKNIFLCIFDGQHQLLSFTEKLVLEWSVTFWLHIAGTVLYCGQVTKIDEVPLHYPPCFDVSPLTVKLKITRK